MLVRLPDNIYLWVDAALKALPSPAQLHDLGPSTISKALRKCLQPGARLFVCGQGEWLAPPGLCRLAVLHALTALAHPSPVQSEAEAAARLGCHPVEVELRCAKTAQGARPTRPLLPTALAAGPRMRARRAARQAALGFADAAFRAWLARHRDTPPGGADAVLLSSRQQTALAALGALAAPSLAAASSATSGAAVTAVAAAISSVLCARGLADPRIDARDVGAWVYGLTGIERENILWSIHCCCVAALAFLDVFRRGAASAFFQLGAFPPLYLSFPFDVATDSCRKDRPDSLQLTAKNDITDPTDRALLAGDASSAAGTWFLNEALPADARFVPRAVMDKLCGFGPAAAAFAYTLGLELGYEVAWLPTTPGGISDREDFRSHAAAEVAIVAKYPASSMTRSITLAAANGVYVGGPFLRFPYFTTFANFDAAVRAAAAAASPGPMICGLVYFWRRHGLSKAAAAVLPFVASVDAVRIADPANSPTAVQPTMASAAGALWGPPEASDVDLAGLDSRPCAFALALPWLLPAPPPSAAAPATTSRSSSTTTTARKRKNPS